jgi:hypothetical protein|uniref:NTF2 domain-containing protein n=1 Tax=Eutreptiella gymnastica TaxID=73025 RepID=A0A7S4FY41_9EUGL|mmetsp:Transcript_29018/g.46914  ORF Transcript_29018/g.46914 Transcript_29018/m.46914 type:complete len:455 (+) Transcript_29018:47-1411(+)|eukprot:CAMPEP_0174372426 /NCGR_PEP_ID=MMETSP0811_2-20130205/103584_1 /TAXON_ID=73025 ORGANISM="Eutreptiella gymnastica-like, Strain CCMP1594" /NCGR_SAMPLE_ID=MMETSP0811_2 /ASSEMBLY_ACC=CAM_ASM_000667 /LENGTH=454 /DNA_ID=CAMNT_0015519843 /DNA_START=47 /DNA_END=1411 /DNA_ORIENTATION=+
MGKKWTLGGRKAQGFNPLGKRTPTTQTSDRSKTSQNQKGKQGERGSDEKRNQFDKVTLKLLNLYLEKMWNPTTRMLDLSGMIKASELAELSPNLNNYIFCSKLARSIADGKPWAQALDSVNLSGCKIYTLKHLAQAFVNKDVRIQNLALANNDIADSAEVDWLVPLKLRELLLHDNPIVKKGDEYHKYVVKKLRTIELLDSVSVREWRKELLIKLPEPQDCCIPDDSRELLFQMLRMYFAAVDNQDYDGLLDAYGKDSWLSLVCEPSTKVYKGPAAAYHDKLMQQKNHNIRIREIRKKPAKAAYKGRPAIMEVLTKDIYGKVKTEHDVSTFKADAAAMGDMVFATVHGSYKYTVAGDSVVYKKSFDRIFVLRPNKTGTQWPARIANDQITLRVHQDTPIIMPAPDMKAQLMATTGLNAAFATLLLKETGGVYDAAVTLFNQNKEKGTIPPDAFQ